MCVIPYISQKLSEIVLKLGSRFFIVAKLLGGPLKRNLPKNQERSTGGAGRVPRGLTRG